MHRISRKLALLSAALTLISVAFVLISPRVSAEYVEHNLIDDALYLDAASMSQASIQSFLQARGSYLAGYSSYSDRDGANVLASQIIYEAAQDYGISPKVILATLQKEQSLVTATNPTSRQLTFAMGYGCPDGGECSYPGFYNQVDNATWQFRFNFERARGNNSWWRSDLYYPCGGATRYYSTGLYPGRNVTFIDDNGVSYKTFTINNAPTASFYCYTPHAYNNPNGLYGNPQFGHTGQYYSGSYNFVKSYELWFGSTQPAVVMSSALRVTGVPEGVYAGIPTNVSFDLKNNTNSAQTVNVAVTVRDSQGGNHDYSLKAVSIPAFGVATYSETRTLSAENNYTFGVTSFVNGMWNDNYPTSSYIDNPRTKSALLQAAPTITVAPASNISDMRIGKQAALSFSVKNNSAQAMDIGKVALALRSPSGGNSDLTLRPTGTLAAGATYVYSELFTPSTTGAYSGFITFTKNNGSTWNESNFPAQISGVSRAISFSVKPNPTLTQGPQLSVTTPRVGQQVTTSFKVKNFGDSAVNLGWVGIAMRDPNGRNVDPGGLNLTVNANSEYTFQVPQTFQTPGTYTAWVTAYRNGTWDDVNYPVAESGTVVRKISFNVLPSPTITASVTSTVANPRVGQPYTLSYKVKNFGTSSVNLGHLGLGGRDAMNRNVDAGITPTTLAPDEEKTITFTVTTNVTGTIRYFVISTQDFNAWGTGPVPESATVSKTLNITVSN